MSSMAAVIVHDFAADFKDFKMLHQVFAVLKKEEMFSGGLVV